MKKLKKAIKIIGIIFLILSSGLLIAAHVLLKPKSDKKVLSELSGSSLDPGIYYNQYKDQRYRVIAMQKILDTTLPTLVFVHGSPGSAMDYKRYFKDSSLNENANILSYDRIGYGPGNSGKILGSIASELDILHHLIKDIPSERVVLIGYSYGGPVILASPKNYKYKVSLASSISADLEPMFWALNLYKWRLTRVLIPNSLKAAAKEKYSHLSDLPKYDGKWNISPSKIINIQGDLDWIVPYENSKELELKIDSDKLEMLTIKDGGHELIWSDFELIRDEIVKTLN